MQTKMLSVYIGSVKDLILLRDSFCLFTVSLSRQQHDVLDFSCCPLSRVLHVTLANLQKFGFEFHLRSSPSAAFGDGRSFNRLLHNLLHSADETQQGRNSCQRVQFLTFSLNSIMSLSR